MSTSYFGDEKETLERKVDGGTLKVEWDWGNFEDTRDFPVDENLINWVIGQEQALSECFLCLDEMVHKLKHLEKTGWYNQWSNPDNSKPVARTMVSPGPYLLLLGDPGTGKSLIGRALAEKLTEIYEEKGIK